MAAAAEDTGAAKGLDLATRVEGAAADDDDDEAMGDQLTAPLEEAFLSRSEEGEVSGDNEMCSRTRFAFSLN